MVLRRRQLFGTWLASIAIALICLSPSHAQTQGPPRQTPSGPPSVPVSVTPVIRKDVANFLHGLGTVQALQTVQLRSQVDGVLLKVPVSEGQDVRKGDVLAIIAPRPYRAALDAATAKKQQDEAL